MENDDLVPVDPTTIIEEWVVKQEGPFWAIVNQYGMVIAAQISDEETARRIARLPELEKKITGL